MEKNLTVLVSIVMFGFLLYVLYNTIRYFGSTYRKHNNIKNALLRFIVALVFAAFYGFFFLHGAVPESGEVSSQD